MNDQSIEKNVKVKYVLTGVALILVGLILLIFPETSLTSVCFILGVIVAVKGIFKLTDYIKLKKVDMASGFSLIGVISTFALAIILFVHPKSLISVIPSLIGLAVVIYGVVGLTSHHSSKVVSIIEIVVGAVVLAVPFAFASAITAVIGVALIVLGVLTFVSYHKFTRLEDEIKTDADGYKEVHFESINNSTDGGNTNAFNGGAVPPEKNSETFEEAGIEDAGEPNPSYDNLDFNEADIKDAEFKDID